MSSAVERLLKAFPGSEVVWPVANRPVPKAPWPPGPDGELALTATGWRCPGCGGSANVFYGSSPGRLCLECWYDAHPDDPAVHRVRHGVRPGLAGGHAVCRCGKALTDPLSLEEAER